MSVQSHLEEPILALVGPTGLGKTDVGIRLAHALNGEVISADSMAVYRGMDIGTAKPSRDEQRAVRFHLLDVVAPDEAFSVAQFKALADQAAAAIRARGNQVLVVGGTGLYVKVLLEDYGLTQTPADPVLRARLDAEALSLGAPALHRRLAEVDAESAARIHPNDRIRIVRSLEVLERTGIPMSIQQAQDAALRARRPSVRVGLTSDRETLYERIGVRVDQMVAGGLEQEVRGLLASGFADRLPPLRSLGYKEMASYVRGEVALHEAVEAIKQNTRRFARRQLTWFRADREIHWIDIGRRSTQDVTDEVQQLWRQKTRSAEYKSGKET